MPSKLQSCAAAMKELDLNAFLITETFLTNRREIKRRMRDFCNENKVDFFQKNRGNDIARGGAAIIVDKNKGTFKEFRPFMSRFETVALVGTLHGYSRKMLIICTYMPPGLRGAPDCLEEIVGLINEAKVLFSDPFIMVGGDFNEFSSDTITAISPDLLVADSPPTRHDRKIDLLITNFNRSFKSSSSLEPLSNEKGTLSDHNLMFYQAELPRKRLAKWVTIKRRKYTPEGEAAFGEWIGSKDWLNVLNAPNVEAEERALASDLELALDAFMPMQSFRVKDDEKPWITNGLRQLIKKKKKIFKNRGYKSEEWKRLRRAIEKSLFCKKEQFYKKQVENLKGSATVSYTHLRGPRDS